MSACPYHDNPNVCPYYEGGLRIPEVDEAFVERWTRKQWDSISPHTFLAIKELLVAMLREAGVKVKEGK